MVAYTVTECQHYYSVRTGDMIKLTRRYIHWEHSRKFKLPVKGKWYGRHKPKKKVLDHNVAKLLWDVRIQTFQEMFRLWSVLEDKTGCDNWFGTGVNEKPKEWLKNIRNLKRRPVVVRTFVCIYSHFEPYRRWFNICML